MKLHWYDIAALALASALLFSGVVCVTAEMERQAAVEARV